MSKQWSSSITSFMKVFDYLRNPTRLKIAYLLFFTILIFSQVYYFYRYIFMLGSEVTSGSPTCGSPPLGVRSLPALRERSLDWICRSRGAGSAARRGQSLR